MILFLAGVGEGVPDHTAQPDTRLSLLTTKICFRRIFIVILLGFNGRREDIFWTFVFVDFYKHRSDFLLFNLPIG